MTATLNDAPPVSPTEEAPTPTAAPRRGKFDAGVLIAILVGLVAIALTLGPIIYLITGGFRTLGNLASDPTGLPDPWMWSNYTSILSDATFWRQLMNSLVVALGTTVGVVL